MFNDFINLIINFFHEDDVKPRIIESKPSAYKNINSSSIK